MFPPLIVPAYRAWASPRRKSTRLYLQSRTRLERGDSDAPLLNKIAGIEPGAAQFLDARAAGPAVVSGLVVGAQRRVAERVDVRDRAIDHREENDPGFAERPRSDRRVDRHAVALAGSRPTGRTDRQALPLLPRGRASRRRTRAAGTSYARAESRQNLQQSVNQLTLGFAGVGLSSSHHRVGVPP